MPGSSIKETAYELGFQHPQHFTRFFRNHVGRTPKDFKSKKFNDISLLADLMGTKV